MSLSDVIPVVPEALPDSVGAPRRAVVLEVTLDTNTPVTAFHKLSQRCRTGFLFESATSESANSRFSILSVDPIELISIRDGVASVSRRGQSEFHVETLDALAFLKQRIELNLHALDLSDVPEYLPFNAGLVGFLGYAATRYTDKIAQQQQDPLGVPDARFGFYDSAVIFDHLYRKVFIVSARGPEHANQLADDLSKSSELQTLQGPVKKLLGSTPSQALNGDELIDSSMSRSDFLSKVDECKELIKSGEAFQIVLAQRFSRKTDAHPFTVYRALQSLNPSPYGYYLQFEDFAYLGASPETMLTCREGRLTVKALAGTRRRGLNPAEDAALECELRADEKERAEHMMLVDLARNDLGRVSKPGTVVTGEIARVVRYAHVMHLSTEVNGELRAELTCFDAVKSCFPAGTVSGAPKIRAMQLLAKLEPERRGIYAGMVGYFDAKGNCDGAIAIRSALIRDGVAHVNAGAGIVFDSVPELEYEETRNKARSVLSAIAYAGSIGGSV